MFPPNSVIHILTRKYLGKEALLHIAQANSFICIFIFFISKKTQDDSIVESRMYIQVKTILFIVV